MSVKMVKDVIGRNEKKEKKKRNIGLYIEILLIVCIIITCVNLIYWLVPTFLSIIFLLLQIRKIANSISNTNEKR